MKKYLFIILFVGVCFGQLSVKSSHDLKPFKSTLKGELTIVISENNIKSKIIDEQKIVNKVKKYLKKYSLKDTVDLILETEKINKKKVYDLCLKVKNENNH